MLITMASRRVNCILGHIKHSIASQAKEVILPLLELAWPHSEYCVPFWSPQYQRNIKILESIQRRERKMVKGMKGRSYGERLGTLCLVWRRKG